LTPPKPLQRYTLPRNKILRSQKAITGLFQPGFFVSSYPLRINYLLQPHADGVSPVLVLFSVSKRRFKKATDRNRIKRILREVYRLNQAAFMAIKLPTDQRMEMALIFTGNELPSFQLMQTCLLQCVQKMERKINHA
jgi:ribonuclease P protein component